MSRGSVPENEKKKQNITKVQLYTIVCLNIKMKIWDWEGYKKKNNLKRVLRANNNNNIFSKHMQSCETLNTQMSFADEFESSKQSFFSIPLSLFN